MIMRYVTQPCELTLASGKKYSFRKGDKIGICPPLTHLDNEVFSNASSFLPERWLAGESEQEVADSSLGKLPAETLSKDGKSLSSSIAFLPFGGGPTYCPGRRFARNEVKTAMVYLLRRYNMEVLDQAGSVVTSGAGIHSPLFPGFDGGRCGLGIFPPLNSCNVRVTKRDI